MSPPCGRVHLPMGRRRGSHIAVRSIRENPTWRCCEMQQVRYFPGLMTRFKDLRALLLLAFPHAFACTGDEAERTNSGTDVGGGNDAGGEAREAAGPRHAGDAAPDASAGSPAEPVLPMACENYWDCPLSLSRTCVDYEGVSASAQAAHGCVDGLCVHLPIQQTCGDGADCEGCLALGRAQYCRRETGDACTVCCYGIFDALLEHEIDPDLDCACAPDARCADACADTTICDGEVAPSLDCLGCLREAFQPDGECSLATDDIVTDESCTNDLLDEGPSCGQFGLCMANCTP